MSSLGDLPELIGFFSYSREDDHDSQGGFLPCAIVFKANYAGNSVALPRRFGFGRIKKPFRLVLFGRRKLKMRSDKPSFLSRLLPRPSWQALIADLNLRHFSQEKLSSAEMILSSQFSTLTCLRWRTRRCAKRTRSFR